MVYTGYFDTTTFSWQTLRSLFFRFTIFLTHSMSF